MISLAIIDEHGNIMVSIVDNELFSIGKHNMVYDLSNLPSGLYLCKLKAGSQKMTAQLVSLQE